jgi:Bifunctional DNA primase/polymerase, N-terminal
MTQPLDLDTIAGHYVRTVEDGHDGLADWFARKLDAADAARAERLRQPDLLTESAAYLASRGLHVFPLSPGTKRPLPGQWTCCGGSHRRGVLDALDHVGAARAWWRTHPTANIGLATGHVIDCIDQDGPEGARWWCRGRDWPAVIGVASTPRAGGVHRFVRAQGLPNGTRIAPGIDYRGKNGYIVAAPSVVNGKRYGWIIPLDLSR